MEAASTTRPAEPAPATCWSMTAISARVMLLSGRKDPSGYPELMPLLKSQQTYVSAQWNSVSVKQLAARPGRVTANVRTSTPTSVSPVMMILRLLFVDTFSSFGDGGLQRLRVRGRVRVASGEFLW